MDNVQQLQPSHSAPDLTDLLDARRTSHDLDARELDELPQDARIQGSHERSASEQQRWMSGIDQNAQDSPNDGPAQQRYRLPTPAESRSPSPESVNRMRLRTESPEVYRRESLYVGGRGNGERSPSFVDDEEEDYPEANTTAREGLLAQPARIRQSRTAFDAEAGARAQQQAREDTPVSRSPSPSSPGSASVPTPSWPSQSMQPAPSASSPALRFLPASLWDYLNEELAASELDGSQELKAERVTNFFSVPMAVEQIIVFGLFVCLDSFLYTFTILPLRCAIALKRLIANYSRPGMRKSLPVSAKCDIAKFSIFVIACAALHHITDASKMYHSVRGQEVIKLYVIFNVLEIADRLCCSFGQDLLDSLCSRATLGRREDGSQPRIRPAGLFAMCVIYTITHTLVLFYSLVSLNVAINSYDNALLTLLLSNQFVEIKGAVFKKFEKENLFQMSCADIVERFQLTLMLFVIALRNLIELSGSTFSLLPTSFVPVMPSMSILQSIFSPALIVILSEMLVDWLKHAFITKFNHIRPAVYGRFIDVLCRDLVTSGAPSDQITAFADQSPALARRLGFAALPLGCLIVRVIFQTIEMLADTSHIDECAPPRGRNRLAVEGGLFSYLSIGPEGRQKIGSWVLWLLIAAVLWSCLIILKLLIGINLRAFAVSRYSTMEERAEEDQRNDRSRQPIGTNASEKAHESSTTRLIQKKEFDSPGGFSGRLPASTANGSTMETLSRFSMVKSRIY